MAQFVLRLLHGVVSFGSATWRSFNVETASWCSYCVETASWRSYSVETASFRS